MVHFLQLIYQPIHLNKFLKATHFQIISKGKYYCNVCQPNQEVQKMGFTCGKITTITQIVLISLHVEWLEVVNYIWRNDNFKIAIGVTNQILCYNYVIKRIFFLETYFHIWVWKIFKSFNVDWYNIIYKTSKSKHIRNWFLLWKVETSLEFEMELVVKERKSGK